MNQLADPTRRFSDRVQDYVRFRPGYPSGIIECLNDERLLAPSDVVADVGSGTGKLSELFLQNGNHVLAVEPNDEMRQAGVALLGSEPRFRAVAGKAEATTLDDACVDVVVAAQAFHWFDRGAARREFLRILRPGGRLVLVWNDRRDDAGPFMADYEDLLQKHATDYRKVDHRRLDEDTIASFFGPQGCGMRILDNQQVLDLEGLEGRLLSCSYLPPRGRPGCDEMLSAMRELFDDHEEDGRVTLVYGTRLYYGRLSKDGKT